MLSARSSCCAGSVRVALAGALARLMDILLAIPARGLPSGQRPQAALRLLDEYPSLFFFSPLFMLVASLGLLGRRR